MKVYYLDHVEEVLHALDITATLISVGHMTKPDTRPHSRVAHTPFTM